MSVIALASAKGSPGVSVTALALAAVWPRRVLVAECDPAGGDLALRWDLPVNPSLLTLAAAARRRLDPDELWRHTQRLPGPDGGAHVRVLLGPPEAEQAAVLGPLWSALGPAFARLTDVDVLVDCGRVASVAPTMGLLRDADLVLLVARPTAEGVAHARARLVALQQSGTRVGLVLVGERPHRPGEVKAALQEAGARPVLMARLADDPRAAAMLGGGPGSRRRLAGSLLVRSARALVERLHERPPASQVPALAARPTALPEPDAPEPVAERPERPLDLPAPARPRLPDPPAEQVERLPARPRPAAATLPPRPMTPVGGGPPLPQPGHAAVEHEPAHRLAPTLGGPGAGGGGGGGEWSSGPDERVHPRLIDRFITAGQPEPPDPEPPRPPRPAGEEAVR